MLKFKSDNGNGGMPGAVYEGGRDIPIAFHLPDIGCPPDIKQTVLQRIAGITGIKREIIPAFILVATNRHKITSALETLGVTAEFRPDEVAIVKASDRDEGDYAANYASA